MGWLGGVRAKLLNMLGRAGAKLLSILGRARVAATSVGAVGGGASVD